MCGRVKVGLDAAVRDRSNVLVDVFYFVREKLHNGAAEGGCSSKINRKKTMSILKHL